MPVKITRHYFETRKDAARRIQRLVKGEPADETNDLAGSEDPGNQMDYAPVEGLLHKYEMGLMYVISTCSAHCRFCYREELIARKEIKRQDGTVAKKGLAQIPEIIRVHSRRTTKSSRRTADCIPKTGREKLREILLSGGDPMVLSQLQDRRVARQRWPKPVSSRFASAPRKWRSTPQRFDDTFLAKCSIASMRHGPQVGLHMMVHFNHPIESSRPSR